MGIPVTTFKAYEVTFIAKIIGIFWHFFYFLHLLLLEMKKMPNIPQKRTFVRGGF